MKVIDLKKPENVWPRLFICGEGVTASTLRYFCGSTLEVVVSDLTLPGQRDGNQAWYTCPVCKRINYLTPQATRDAFAAHI